MRDFARPVALALALALFLTSVAFAASPSADPALLQATRAADAAIDQARWAKWTFWLTAAGTAGLVGTLVLGAVSTRAAWTSASSALQTAKAAADAQVSADAATERKLRPWIKIDTGLHPNQSLDKHPNLDSYRIWPWTKLRNVGAGAAQNVRITLIANNATFHTGEWLDARIKECIDAAREDQHGGDFLAPTDEARTEYFLHLKKEDIDRDMINAPGPGFIAPCYAIIATYRSLGGVDAIFYSAALFVLFRKEGNTPMGLLRQQLPMMNSKLMISQVVSKAF